MGQGERVNTSDGVQPGSAGRSSTGRRDHWVLAAASVAALAALTAYWAKTSHWGSVPVELKRLPKRQLDYKIDLNEANWVQWSQLPGIGPVLAKRIVEERQRHGPFRNLDDLQRVKGIGPKRLRALRPFVREDGAGQPTEMQRHQQQ